MADNLELLKLRAKAKLKLQQEQAAAPAGSAELIEKFRPIIKEMESGGRYDIYHPKTKSGKQALGAYGIIPEFWFDQFPELGLNSKDSTSKKYFVDNPAVQDSLFSKIAAKGIAATGGDPAKFRAWYYGGPKAVQALEKNAADGRQTAYDDTGKPIAMPSVQDDSDKFISKLAPEDATPAQMATLDTRAMAGLPPLRYPKNEAASALYNNPEAQAEAVQNAKSQAISNLPIREQMGAGMGAFAYKFPGMGTLSELSGLAPKGSAQNKETEIQEYNRNRTGAQLAGEMLPDVLLSSLGGVAAAQASGASKLASPTVRRLAEGAMAGGVSAAGHQLQHLGSGESIQPLEAGIEMAVSAALPAVGGKIGDALKKVAPKVLRSTIRPTADIPRSTFNDALEEGMVPTFGGLKGAKARTDKALIDLENLQSSEALKASQRAVPIRVKEPTIPPAAAPRVRPQAKEAVPVEDIPLATLAEPTPKLPTKPANHPTNKDFIGPKPAIKKKTPSKADAIEAETLAKKDAEARELDIARRKAEAAARRNPPAKKETPPSKVKKEPPPLSGAEQRLRSLQELADEGAIKEAFEAEKALELQKKLKGQRGSLNMDWAFPKPPPKGMIAYKDPHTKETLYMTPSMLGTAKASDAAAEAVRKAPKEVFPSRQVSHRLPNGDLVYINKEMAPLAKESDRLANLVNRFKSQQGAITNPFYKETPAPSAKPVEMVESRKLAFKEGPLKEARRQLELEMNNPKSRTLTANDYEQAKQTLDIWEADARSRPTTKGGPRSQMTIEDALAFSKAIKAKITGGDTGSNRAHKLLLKSLEAKIKELAPEVGKSTEKLEKLRPFKEALDTRVAKNDNKVLIPASIKLAGLAGGSALGALNSGKGSKTSGALQGAALGLMLSQLATTPGGAAILYKTGKTLGDRTTVKGNTLAQLIRSGAVKSREKK